MGVGALGVDGLISPRGPLTNLFKDAFGIMAWPPLAPSTASVMLKSTATLHGAWLERCRVRA
jgi:hypothetical protein